MLKDVYTITAERLVETRRRFRQGDAAFTEDLAKALRKAADDARKSVQEKIKDALGIHDDILDAIDQRIDNSK